MIRIGLCNRDKDNSCEKKDSCLRYIQEYGEPMNMLAVCNKENDYKYYWLVETQIQTTEKDKDTNEENTESK